MSISRNEARSETPPSDRKSGGIWDLARAPRDRERAREQGTARGRLPSSNPAAIRRGQAAIELFTIAIIFAAVFSIMSGIYQNEFSATSRRVQVLALRQIAGDISLSINSAVLQGDGYAANLTLPYKIGASDFYANVTEGVVTVTIAENKLSTASRIMVKNVTGAFRSGQNLLKNAGGRIYVE